MLNYAIAYTGANLGITPALLTVTANAGSKVYGDVDPALTFAASGFKFLDNAASALTGGLMRTAGENVGSYAINQGALMAGNYTIVYSGANFGIAPALLTITANDAVKTLGSTTNFTGTEFTANGLPKRRERRVGDFDQPRHAGDRRPGRLALCNCGEHGNRRYVLIRRTTPSAISMAA